MNSRRAALAVALGLTVAASLSAPARAADQTVLGKSFVVKDPAPGVDSSLRSVVVLGKELPNDDSVVGSNPLANGATVEIIANGTTSTAQTFALPSGASIAGSPGWKVIGNPVVIGYSYKDAGGVNGPVKAALIKDAGNGTFIVKVTLKGALGPGPQPHITVVPPAPGTDGGMRFTVNGGDTYCVAFGGAAGGAVTNAPTRGTPNKVFKIVSKPPLASTVEAGCPSASTPTTSTTSTSSTTTSTTSTTSTTLGTVLKAVLPATTGRFNYNLNLGVPGANTACAGTIPSTHVCTYAELQSAESNADLDGIKDTNNVTVTSFWAIDSTHANTLQCTTTIAWDYATAHTGRFAEMVSLNNGTGVLGPLMSGAGQGAICAGSSWVGCCQ